MTPSTDIYSIGATFYKIISGRDPFPGNSIDEIMISKLKTSPPRISDILPQINPEIDSLLTSMLDPDPLHRPENVFEIRNVIYGVIKSRQKKSRKISLQNDTCEGLFHEPEMIWQENTKALMNQICSELCLEASMGIIIKGEKGSGISRFLEEITFQLIQKQFITTLLKHFTDADIREIPAELNFQEEDISRNTLLLDFSSTDFHFSMFDRLLNQRFIRKFGVIIIGIMTSGNDNLIGALNHLVNLMSSNRRKIVEIALPQLEASNIDRLTAKALLSPVAPKGLTKYLLEKAGGNPGETLHILEKITGTYLKRQGTQWKFTHPNKNFHPNIDSPGNPVLQNSEILLNLAIQNEKKGELKQALSLVTQALDALNLERGGQNRDDFENELRLEQARLLIKTGDIQGASVLLYSLNQQKLDKNQFYAKFANEFGNYYHAAHDYPQAKVWYKKSIIAYRNLHELKGEADSTGNLGLVYWRNGQPDPARKLFERSLKIREKINDKEGMGISLESLGILLLQNGDFIGAKNAFDNSLQIRRELNDINRIGSSLNNLGLLYNRIGAFDKAKKSFLECLTSLERAGDTPGIARCHNNLGLSCLNSGDLEQARNHFLKSRDIMNSLNDEKALVGTLNNLGSVSILLFDLEKAVEYYRQSLKLCHSFTIAREEYQAHPLEGLGHLFFIKGSLKRSMFFFRKANQIYERKKDRQKQLLVSCQIGRILSLFNEKSGAEAELNMALTTAYEIGASERIPFLFFELAHMELDSSYREKAIQYLNQAEPYVDESIPLARASLSILKGRISVYSSRVEEGLREIRRGIKLLLKDKKIIESLIGLFYLWEINRNLLDRKKYIAEKYLSFANHLCRLHGYYGWTKILGNWKERSDTGKSWYKVEKGRGKFISPKVHLHLIYRISDLINARSSIEEIAYQILDIALEGINAERGLIFFHDSSENKLVLKVARNMEKESIEDVHDISNNVIRNTVANKKALYSSNAQYDECFKNYKSILKYKIQSFICAPLKLRDDIMGTIYVDSRSMLHTFSSEEVEFVLSIANLATAAIENAKEVWKIIEEKEKLEKVLKREFAFTSIVGKSQTILEVVSYAKKIVRGQGSILIQGETGVGKGFLARILYLSSDRKDKPFIEIDCGAIPMDLLESELFGYCKGSFTGANNDKPGLIELSSGGMLFMDEITNMPLSVQAKLLRVLEEKSIRRLGETVERQVDFRLISATNKNLDEEVEKGNFREDLKFRINTFALNIPPLRNRKEDIPLLAEHFLREISSKHKKVIKKFHPKSLEILKNYSWPGNVRELNNIIERGVTFCYNADVFTTDLLPESMLKQGLMKHVREFRKDDSCSILEKAEKELILESLEQNGWIQTKTASFLGISERYLRFKMKKFGIPGKYERQGKKWKNSK